MDKYKILFHCHILCDPKWREKKLNFLQVLITIKKQRQWNYEMRKKLFKSNKINPFHCRKKMFIKQWWLAIDQFWIKWPMSKCIVFFTSLSYMIENCINFISLHQSHVVCLYSLKKIFFINLIISLYVFLCIYAAAFICLWFLFRLYNEIQITKRKTRAKKKIRKWSKVVSESQQKNKNDLDTQIQRSRERERTPWPPMDRKKMTKYQMI